jgi:hypothetical protein
MEKPLTKQQMKDYIQNFRKKLKTRETDVYSIVNINTKIHDSIDDRDFYVNFLGCVICQRKFNGYTPLFLHMTWDHPEWDVYHCESENPDTSMREGHIFTIKNKYAYEESETREDFARLFDSESYQRTAFYSFSLKDINCDLLKNETFSTKYSNLNNRGEKNSSCSSVGAFKDKDKKTTFKKYPDPELNRVFFHSVTGGILNEDSDDSDYVVDEDDMREYHNKDIDEYADICESDKGFFKLWNNFMYRVK